MSIPGTGLAKGLAVTLRTMGRRSVTAQYPEVKPDLPPRSRGVIALFEENCTVCMLCARECPDWCIYIDSHKEVVPAREPGARDRTRNVLDRFAIDFALCMYCGICIEVCPFDALFWSPEFEYAETDIAALTHEKERLREWMWTVPPPPPLDEKAEEPKEIGAARKTAEKLERSAPPAPAQQAEASPGPRPAGRHAARPASPSAAPPPPAVAPSPSPAEPPSAAVEPSPAAVEPSPAAVEPSRAAVEPSPGAVEPSRAAVEPSPAVAEPSPAPPAGGERSADQPAPESPPVELAPTAPLPADQFPTQPLPVDEFPTEQLQVEEFPVEQPPADEPSADELSADAPLADQPEEPAPPRKPSFLDQVFGRAEEPPDHGGAR